MLLINSISFSVIISESIFFLFAWDIGQNFRVLTGENSMRNTVFRAGEVALFASLLLKWGRVCRFSLDFSKTWCISWWIAGFFCEYILMSLLSSSKFVLFGDIMHSSSHVILRCKFESSLLRLSYCFNRVSKFKFFLSIHRKVLALGWGLRAFLL